MNNLNKFELMFPPSELNTRGDRWLINSRGSQVVRYNIYMSIIRSIFSQGNNKKKYMDIACAQSQILNFTRKEFPSMRLYGSDISKNVINWNKSKHNSIQYQQSALPNIGFGDEKFDVISAFEVIYYLSKDDQVEAIRNISKRLSNDGYMIISGGLDKGDRYFSEEWLIKKIEEVISIDCILYDYAKCYRFIETPLLKTINIIRKVQYYHDLSKEELEDIGKKPSVVRRIALMVVSNKWLYVPFNIVQFVFIKASFLVLKWEWLPKFCSLITKKFFGEKGRTNIIIVCRKSVFN